MSRGGSSIHTPQGTTSALSTVKESAGREPGRALGHRVARTTRRESAEHRSNPRFQSYQWAGNSPQDLGEKDSNHRQTIAGKHIIMENYIPVFTTKGRPLAPCHPKRGRSLVRAGKAQFKYRRGIVLRKTTVPKVKNTSKLQLRIDPGSKHTGATSVVNVLQHGSADLPGE